MRACLMFAIAATALASPALARAESLDLVCRGETQTYAASGPRTIAFNTRAGTPSGVTTEVRPVARPGEFRLRLDESGARVAPPDALRPTLSWLAGAGLGDGWWALSVAQLSDARLSGDYSHNLLYSPHVELDRASGAITVQALAGDRFTGICQAAG